MERGRERGAWFLGKGRAGGVVGDLVDASLLATTESVLARSSNRTSTPIEVRLWFSELTKRGKPSPATCSKLYRLLRTILNTAVEDELIPKNACNIKGAGNELSAERPVATIEQVDASAEGVEERYRVLVYLATYTTLRFGELFGLRRKDVDLGSGRVEVTQQEGHLAGGLLVFGPPKSAAGRRTVAIPNFLLPDVAAHLERFVGPGPDQFVSEDRAASFRADRTGARCGGGWSSRPASRVCASTTCGTPAIRSLLQREHRRRS